MPKISVNYKFKGVEIPFTLDTDYKYSVRDNSALASIPLEDPESFFVISEISSGGAGDAYDNIKLRAKEAIFFASQEGYNNFEGVEDFEILQAMVRNVIDEEKRKEKDAREEGAASARTMTSPRKHKFIPAKEQPKFNKEYNDDLYSDENINKLISQVKITDKGGFFISDIFSCKDQVSAGTIIEKKIEEVKGVVGNSEYGVTIAFPNRAKDGHPRLLVMQLQFNSGEITGGGFFIADSLCEDEDEINRIFREEITPILPFVVLNENRCQSLNYGLQSESTDAKDVREKGGAFMMRNLRMLAGNVDLMLSDSFENGMEEAPRERERRQKKVELSEVQTNLAKFNPDILYEEEIDIDPDFLHQMFKLGCETKIGELQNDLTVFEETVVQHERGLIENDTIALASFLTKTPSSPKLAEYTASATASARQAI